MASSLLDVCRFTPTLGGTTDWTYSSAVTGYQSPASAGVVNGAQYSYRAESADLSQWEIGTGTYNTSTGVLSRTTILFSTNSNAKVSFSAAPQVAIVALAEDLLPVSAVTPISASLVADVAISNSVYTDGPSIAQGTVGTWFVSGSITFMDTLGNGSAAFKLWDGTTVIASARARFDTANGPYTVSLSGFIANPAGNLRISGTSNAAGATSAFKFNLSGNSKDSTITAYRIK